MLRRAVVTVSRRFSSSVVQSTPSTSKADGPGLEHFIAEARTGKSKWAAKIQPTLKESDSYISAEDYHGRGQRVKLRTYGCQMNVSDTEVVRAILQKNGYVETERDEAADFILLMTCSIRESAETKIWAKLEELSKLPKRPRLGVLGCMAERLRESLSEKGGASIVAGPDSYQDLPRLLALSALGHNAMNVQLSLEETYADVAPVRVDANARSAYISIMRGCDNMCSFCVVPFTRGRERSRPLESIVDHVKRLRDEGVRQVILLGQNVNSYRDTSSTNVSTVSPTIAPGFKTVYKPKTGGRTFVDLLEAVADVDPEVRIRFTSAHPKDFPMPVLQLMASRRNICRQLHVPAQSGSSRVLEQMNRGYSREAYDDLIQRIYGVMPDAALTSDFIAGFCSETEQDHEQTVDLMRKVDYSASYVFPYSMREKTRAHRRLEDDVPLDVKQRRHQELAAAGRNAAHRFNQTLIGTRQLVLVERASRRTPTALVGRCDAGVNVVFGNQDARFAVGDYVEVEIHAATSQTLHGRAIAESATTLANFYRTDDNGRQEVRERRVTG